MLQEAISYLIAQGKALADVTVKEFEGRTYTNRKLEPLEEPTPKPLQISTLSSLADLCTGKFHFPEETPTAFERFRPHLHVVHVCNETAVEVISAISDAWCVRDKLMECRLTETAGFLYGKFLTQDNFIIGLLSGFVASPDRDELVRLAGAATAQAITTSHDDGIAQEVTVKGGAHMVEKVAAKRIIKLAPYRTFREVIQPESDFLVRVQQSGENLPTFALFEADGGKWKLEAIENIARYLRVKLGEHVTVVS